MVYALEMVNDTAEIRGMRGPLLGKTRLSAQ